MMPRTGRAPKRRAAASSSTRRDEADIYGELVAEATSETDFHSHDERPLKRRKPVPVHLGKQPMEEEQVKQDVYTEESQSVPSRSSSRPSPELRYAHDDDSDSDLAFEDVSLDEGQTSSDEELGDVHVALGDSQDDTPTSARRRPVSRMEKSLRVLGHKAHLVALLGHCMIVNSRCNDVRVHRALKPILTSTVRSYLRPSRQHTQFQQDRTFTMGLERAVAAFKEAFQVNATGMKRPYWQNDHELEGAEVVDRQDFIRAAQTLSGSQDTGNQLFCALLRSAGVKARLVCSLQVLPLSNASAAPQTPTKPRPVFAIASDTPPERPDNLSIRERAVASARSRIGQPAFQAQRAPAQPKARSYHKLAYPVFWTEVLNVAYQKWMPVDPIVTQTINKASKLEPPLLYQLNQLVYAIAFSKNGSAKDVTRRYAKAYNAKTRRTRIESIDGGLWFRKVMRMFAKQSQSDADVLEEAELTQRIAREGLPGNIQDFKGHPVYALERHLKRHEVVHPRREAGKINAGTAANPKMEPIFRREDVHACRSADQWFRHGRVVKPGEQSLKLVPARQKRKDSDDECEAETALYILSQTELYIPKPVVRGKIPRNAFGNLDIYVPSMVPAGGVHVRHALAKQAAAILQIDAVDAVTGFKFSNRKAATVIEGAVVPEQYQSAVQAVIEGLLWQEVDERSRARSALAMRMWKRLLQGLKIAERVASYATEPMQLEADPVEMSSSTAWYAEEVSLHTAGRYTLDELVESAKAAKRKMTFKKAAAKTRAASESDDEAVGDDQADENMAGGFLAGDASPVQNDTVDGFSGGGGGGFIVEDESADQRRLAGGGFMEEDESTDQRRPAGGGFIEEDGSTDEPRLAGGGFIADDDSTDQPRHVGRDFIEEEPRPAGGGFVEEDWAANEPRPGASGTLDAYNTSDSEPRRATSEAEVVVVEDDSDDSLLSHDPEDEDAEPDWMESD